MNDNDIKTKIDDLNQRIEQARKNSNTPDNIEPSHADEEATENEIKSARAGSEFLASVFAGGFLGYGIDWLFGTLPWGMISFLVLGFVSGVYRANAATKQSNED